MRVIEIDSKIDLGIDKSVGIKGLLNSILTRCVGSSGTTDLGGREAAGEATDSASPSTPSSVDSPVDSSTGSILMSAWKITSGRLFKRPSSLREA